MALERGGYAEKLGSRYEGRWVTRQMLMVLAEQLRSITVEAIGDDEKGVDLWIERADGTREAQQCKSGNRDRPGWSMADLNRAGILESLRFQIERSKHHEFMLVSPCPAVEFQDLARSARDSTGDARQFYNDQVKNRSNRHNRAFAEFCRYLGLDANVANDLIGAFQLLRRTGAHVYCDDGNSRTESETLAKLLIKGNPATVISVLAELAEDSLRKTLHVDEIISHLAKHDLIYRRLDREDRLFLAIDQLRTTFFESLSCRLAGGCLIRRLEMDTILEKIEHTDAKTMVVVHGKAGFGKSGCLLGLAQELKAREIPWLPIRLDVNRPRISAEQLGDDLNLPDSPVLCLSKLAGDRRAVLILDQLDALRWTSGHASEPLEICRELVGQSKLLGNVIVVCACRTFDLEHDPGLRSLAENSVLDRIAIGELPETVVREAIGEGYEQLDPRLRSLLRSVQNLTMWLMIRARTGVAASVMSSLGLMHEFWRFVARQAGEHGVTDSELNGVVDALVRRFEERRGEPVPMRIIESQTRAVNELQSLNVVVGEGNSVRFAHQSYLDYQVAVRVANALDANDEAVVGWLGPKPNQALFRREQLRYFLGYLRDENPRRFLAIVRRLLQTVDVRFHVKQLTLQLLGGI